jgi:hypothetical protein
MIRDGGGKRILQEAEEGVQEFKKSQEFKEFRMW